MRIVAGLALLALASPSHAQDAASYIARETPDLVGMYKDLHSHPEFSHHEARTSVAAGLPPQKAATVTVLDDESTPVEYNDPELSARVRDVLVKAFGTERVLPVEKVMGSEDVGVFGMSADLKRYEIPVAYFRLGAMDPAKFAAARAPASCSPGRTPAASSRCRNRRSRAG